jgi:hypothetical protein
MQKVEFFYKLKGKLAELVWNAKSTTFFNMHSSTAFGGAWCNFRGIICSKLIKTYQQPIVSYFTNHPFGSREVTRRQRCTWPFDSLSLGQVWLEALSAKIRLPLRRRRHTAAFRMGRTLQRTPSYGWCLNFTRFGTFRTKEMRVFFSLPMLECMLSLMLLWTMLRSNTWLWKVCLWWPWLIDFDSDICLPL